MHVNVSIMLEEGETFETDMDDAAISVHEVLELDSEKDSVVIQVALPPPPTGMAGKAKKEKEERQI